MSSLRRSIARGIARKNGMLKTSRGRSPNFRGQVFKPQVKKNNAFMKLFNAIYKRNPKEEALHENHDGNG